LIERIKQIHYSSWFKFNTNNYNIENTNHENTYSDIMKVIGNISHYDMIRKSMFVDDRDDIIDNDNNSDHSTIDKDDISIFEIYSDASAILHNYVSIGISTNQSFEYKLRILNNKKHLLNV